MKGANVIGHSWRSPHLHFLVLFLPKNNSIASIRHCTKPQLVVIIFGLVTCICAGSLDPVQDNRAICIVLQPIHHSEEWEVMQCPLLSSVFFHTTTRGHQNQKVSNPIHVVGALKRENLLIIYYFLLDLISFIFYQRDKNRF